MSRGGRLSEAGPRVRRAGHIRIGTDVIGPVRTCIGCRERGPRSELLRIVAVADSSGNSQAVVDARGVLPGRGAWVHPELRCLDLAERRRALPRALRVETLDVTEVREHLQLNGLER